MLTPFHLNMSSEIKAREELQVDGVEVELERVPALAIAIFEDGRTEYIWADDPHTSKFTGLTKEFKDFPESVKIKWSFPLLVTFSG